MNFKKEELDFLNLYAICETKADEMSQKFEVVSNKETNTITFTQFSDSTKLITVLEGNGIGENFKLILPTDKFVKLLRSCNKEETININGSGVDFNSGGHYDFGTEEWSNQEELKGLQEKLQQRPTSSLHIKNLNLLPLVKPYIGGNGLNVVHLNKGYFVGSNKFDSTGAIKTENSEDVNLFIPLEVVTICSQFKLTELDFNVYSNNDPMFCNFVVGDTQVLFINDEENYIVPDVFEKETIELYKHPNHVVIDKTELLQALNKIKIVAIDNLDNRIFITVRDNYIAIESKDNIYAIEKVNANISDEKIQDVEILISAMYLHSMISGLTGDKVIISIPVVEEDPIAVEIRDEIADRFYIHCIFECID